MARLQLTVLFVACLLGLTALEIEANSTSFVLSVMEQGCKARHPWTASGAHGEPKLGGMVFEFRNQNGAVVNRLCAGKPYAFTVSFEGASRSGLVTAHGGEFHDSASSIAKFIGSPFACKNRAFFGHDEVLRKGTDQPSFTTTYTAPACGPAGVLFEGTFSAVNDIENLYQDTITMPLACNC